MSRSTSGSTSSDLANKGKNFLKRLLYVQHVDKEKDMASEIPDRYLEEFLKADRTNFQNSNLCLGFPTDFHDSNFTKYLQSPKSNLSILKSSMGDWIDKVTVYYIPLPIPALPVNDVTIHAFVVFQTLGISSGHWWSLEKNGTYIVLQQSPNKDDVINKIYDTETKTSVERLGPIKKQKSDSAQNFVSDLMQIIVDTNMLNERYNLASANCQNFASFVFGELSYGLSYGLIEWWSTVTSAIVDRLKKKKIQIKIKVEESKYFWLVNDGRFDYYKAMMEGRRKDFEELILTIETLNSVDSQGYTLLEWATVFSSSHWPIDEFLKENGAQIPSGEKLLKQNLFFIALQYLPSNTKSKFLSFADIDINGVNGTGDTALHLALYGEKWEIAEEILNRFEDYDVNITNSSDDTPLLLAAKLKCEFGLFKKILNLTDSEKVNKADGNGRTALHYAIDEESETKVEELLARSDVNVDIKNKDHESALLLASTMTMNFPSDLFKLILEKSKDINSQDKDGGTALHWAIFHKSKIMTKKLLEHKDVDVNVKNEDSCTSLHFACWWTDIPVDLFKLILEKSTDVINARDRKGCTALHFAILFKSEIATKELLAHSDVNVNIKNNRNETALHLASEWWYISADLFKMILKKSTYVINAQDKDGKTALHLAILFKSEIAVKGLLAHNDVDVNIQNNRNEKALMYVSYFWKDIPSHMFKLILERKANDEVEKICKMDRLFKYLRNLTVHK